MSIPGRDGEAGRPIEPRSRADDVNEGTTSTAELSGGSSRATILSLYACPYRATACYPRPQRFRSYPRGNCSDTGGDPKGWLGLSAVRLGCAYSRRPRRPDGGQTVPGAA